MHDWDQAMVHSNIADLFKHLDPDKTVIIYSKTSWEKAIKVGAPVSPEDIFICNVSKQIPYSTYDACVNKDIDTIVGVGGGTAIDIAKYLAYKYSRRCIAVPSMLSTNVFATDKVAEITPKGKITTQGALPDEVWIDEDFLKLSMKENLYGLADAMSIGTALNDWIIAENENNEIIDHKIYGMACETLCDALEASITTDNLLKLCNVIAASGYITNEYGSGRPESGSEHIVAKEIERLLPVPHAVAVTCGIATMGQLQPYSVMVRYLIPTALKRLGLYNDVKKYIKIDVLYKAISNVTARPDRYTIIDHYLKIDKAYFQKHADVIIETSGLYD